MELVAVQAMPIELELASLAMRLVATLAIAKQLLLQLVVDWPHCAMEQSSHFQLSLFLQ